MQRELILRRLGQVEPGVEALGREGRRDPVRERRHQIGRELEILRLDQVDDARLVLGELGPPALLDRLEVGGGDHVALAALARQQDAAFLERLAHAGDAELEFVGRDLVGAAAARLAACGSPSASSSLPPGNTSAPEKASMAWWRTTMKTSSGEPASPGLDGRSSRTVVAGRAAAALSWAMSVMHGLSHT